MGPVYLFAGSIPEALLRSVRQLGPGYAFSFEPSIVDSREVAFLPTRDPNLRALSELGAEGGTNDLAGTNGGSGSSHRTETAAAARQDLHLSALSGALTPLIILAYNSSVWDGEYFLDNTPEHNPVRWTNRSQAPPAVPKGAEPGAPQRGHVIYSMAGSQAHVYIQPRRASNPTGDGGGGRPAHAHSSHRADAPARARGWSGWSGCSGEENICGGQEGENTRRVVRPSPRPGHMHAMRLPGTRECMTRDVRDALDCLGGVKVLLPLFAQYDHGVWRGGGGVSYETDSRLNETVLALLAGTLRDRYVSVCACVSFRVS